MASEIEAENVALRAEVERLLERVRELESARGAEALSATTPVLQAILDNTPALMLVKDIEGRFVLLNEEYGRFLGRPLAELLGKVASDVLPPEAAAVMEELDRKALAEGRYRFERLMPHHDGDRTYLTVKFPIADAEGRTMGVGTVAFDITSERQAQAEQALLQAKIIETHEATIRELASPLLPIARGVVAIPIVGTIDDRRAEQIMLTLLEGISRLGARVAILDITGVRTVDTAVAHGLVRAAQAASLIGAKVVLSGTSPNVAQALVELGADLTGIQTVGTLQAAMAWAMNQR
jgi:rsbT co-antagonist protein RsbR